MTRCVVLARHLIQVSENSAILLEMQRNPDKKFLALDLLPCTCESVHSILQSHALEVDR